MTSKGEWCSTLYKDATKICELRIEKKGELLRSVDADGNPKFVFRVEKGNPHKL